MWARDSTLRRAPQATREVLEKRDEEVRRLEDHVVQGLRLQLEEALAARRQLISKVGCSANRCAPGTADICPAM